MKKHLVAFIEWLSNKEDVFYAFDNADRAAEEFITERTMKNQEK